MKLKIKSRFIIFIRWMAKNYNAEKKWKKGIAFLLAKKIKNNIRKKINHKNGLKNYHLLIASA